MVAMTPGERAAALVAEQESMGRPLEFVERDPASKAHVVGPDEDQPTADSFVDFLMYRRFRTVCGPVVKLLAPAGTVNAPFEDMRLCHLCREAFGDEAWRIFHDNTEDVQYGAASLVFHIQQLKRAAAERAEQAEA